MDDPQPTGSSADREATRATVMLPSDDLASVLPFSDLATHVAPPLAMQCVWSPNGMFIRVILANLSNDELTGVRITARTTAGQALWMQAAQDDDLTRITPRSTVMMGVRTFDDAPGELPLNLDVTYEPDGRARFDEVMPESAERY